MKTTNLFYFFLLILIAEFLPAFSQKPKSNEEFKRFEIELNYMRLSSSSYYNLNDSNIYTLSIYDEANDTTLNYTFDYYHSTIGLRLRYNYNSNLALSLYSPLSFYSLDEKFLTDEFGYRKTKASYSMNRVDYIGLTAFYRLVDKPIYANIIGEVRCPTGFHDGLYNDTSRNFLSDGAFEFLIGTNFGIKYRTVGWENTVSYNYRAEDYRDQMIINTAVVFSNVQNTELRLFGDFIISTSSFDNARQLNVTETVSQENKYSVGAAFFMMFSESFNVGINYQVTLGGKNTWKSSFFNVKAGIRL